MMSKDQDPSTIRSIALEGIAIEAPAAIALTASSGDIVFANAECERLFGYPPGELLGCSVEILVPEELRAGHVALREAFLQEPETTRPLGLCRDLVGRRADGTELPIEIGLRSIDTPLGDRLVIATIVDLTERKKREQAQLDHAAELERLNRDIEEFAYVASHDLRQPLRAIDNLVGWTIEDLGDQLPGLAAEHLSKVRRQICRMDALLTGLLVYARSTQVEPPTEEVDVGEMLGEIELMLGVPDQLRMVVGPMPTLLTQRAPLDQVFRNLIGNAVKHRTSDPVTVTVHTAHRGDTTEFTVSDDGPGIAPQFQERVFDMFQTLQSQDRVEGTGIGLALVRRLVESNGGSITLASDGGRGATFRFTWPAAAP